MSYTYLSKNSIMSELSNYRRLPLGETEKLFVVRFAVCSPYSAYEAYTDMKKIKPMSYKNVHNKIRRLVALGLLQKDKGKFKRNAIKYKLTTRGLFERLLMSRPPADLQVFELYRDNIILQTIVYEYFEHTTVQKLAEHSQSLAYITNYIATCCETILREIEHNRHEDHTDLDDGMIRWIILREAIGLIIDMTILSSLILNDAQHPNVTTLLPIPALAKDEKFISYLHSMKQALDLGYNKIVSLSGIREVKDARGEIISGAGMLDSYGNPLVFKRKDETL